MKKILNIALCLIVLGSYGQEVLNKRYDLSSGASIFGSVIATDSCYYTVGMQLDAFGAFSQKGAFTKINFDGTIENIFTLDIDSLGVSLWEHPNLIKTLDGNFAQIARVVNSSGAGMFMYVKFSPNGDTLKTNLLSNFYYQEGYGGVQASTVIQNNDSTYFGLVHTFRTSDLVSCVTLIKMDKNGNLLWHKYFCGIGPSYFRVLLGTSLLKYSDNSYVIGSTMIHSFGSGDETDKYVPKLIFIDSLGNLQNEIIFWEDSLVPEIRGLTKTIDGGLLWCSQSGIHNTELGGLDFKRSITKLKNDFTKDWQIEEGIYAGFSLNDNNMILSINDNEFVTVGNHVDSSTINTTGNLTKFNLQGEIIWSREYYNVPHFWGESNGPTHVLYDVDMTLDSGFVMVGQSQNFYNNGYDIGQQAWLVKVDKYGCMVPNCQLYDNPDSSDTTITVEPPVIVSEPKPNVLYPNPANEEIYYYHHQDEFTGKAKAYVFDASGQRIYDWFVTQNNITYIIPTSGLESGVYILKVIEGDQIIRKEKFIVEH